MNNENKFNADLVNMDEFIQLQDNNLLYTEDPDSKAIYEKNLKALSKRHSKLSELIESTTIDKTKYQVYSSESGSPRIVCKKDDDSLVNIHSSDDPTECANKAVELLGEMEKEGILVLAGFGLGYFAEEVFKKIGKGHIILIYEAVPELFKIAMQLKDFSNLFESDKVNIVIGERADDFSMFQRYHNLVVTGKFWIIKHYPSLSLNNEAYERFYKRLEEEKRNSYSAVNTIVGRGKEFLDALMQAVPFTINKPGVTGLLNIFKGRPAIIVSAGPSLDKNVHLLKRATRKAIIIAVDGALQTLLLNDIIPDIIVAIDPVRENIDDKFLDVPELEKVPLICLSQYTPELISLYPGPVFINGVPANVVYNWLKGTMGDKGYIECFGGSVAHLAFATAEHVGSDVIALIGQDFSFKADRAHTIGYSDVVDTMLKESERKGLKQPEGTVPVTDMFGDDAYAIHQFLIYKTSFENKIRESSKTIVNSTEGGLLIEGAVNMRLTDFIAKYCDNLDEIDTFSVLSELAQRDVAFDIDALISTVKKTRDIFHNTNSKSKIIIKYINKLKKLEKRGQKESDEFHNILAKIGELSEKIKNPMHDLLASYHYALELYLSKQDVKDIDDIDDEWERYDKQIKRGENYYKEIIEASRLFNRQLDKLISALQIEKNVHLILENTSVKAHDKYSRIATLYRNGNAISMTVKYIEKAIEVEKEVLNSDQNTEKIAGARLHTLHMSLVEMYMKQFRYYKALELLEEISTNAELEEESVVYVRKLQKTCKSCISQWNERKRTILESMKNAEINYGEDLESGYFYFRIKEFPKAKAAYTKAIESDKHTDNTKRTVEAYYGLAHSYLEMDDPENAFDTLEKAIKIDPSNPILYRDLGLIAFQNNHIEPAELFFLKAIELAPGEFDLYKSLADIYMNCGKSEKAVTLYENALQSNADNPLILKELAGIYRENIEETKKN